MHSRLAVLIVADLVDYSRLMGEDEALAIGTIRELKNKHLEPPMVERGGEILKRMGDGWIIAFSSVPAATQCAMEVQNKLVAHPVIKLRMGVHIGEIMEDDNDFYGAGVNLATRLQAEAPPGGILISQDLYRQLTGDLAKAYSDAGSFKLKNISPPVNGYQWRPEMGQSANVGEVPTIFVEPFAFAPDNGETDAATGDLRDQLILGLSKRTGVRILDGAAGNANESVYVLRGRLRISGIRGRLNIALIDRENGGTVWNQVYEGDTSDIISFCDELIEKSVADLRFQINAFDDNRKAHLPDDQLSVSELRSRAASNFFKCTMDSWEHARKLLSRALRLNSTDPMALAMRANATALLASARFEPIDEKQIEHLASDLNQAVEIAPRSDYVFTVRSYFKTSTIRDASGAMQDAERALSLNSSYHVAYFSRGMANMLVGNLGNGISDFEKAISLSETDRFLPGRLFGLSIAYYLAKRPQEANDTIDRAIQLRPSERSYYVLKSMICRSTGDYAGGNNAESKASHLPKVPSVLAPRPSLPEDKTDFVNQLSPN